jgi:hypothetical protein
LSLGTDSNKITKYIESFESESRALTQDICNLSVWSSNPIQVVWDMPYTDRVILSEVVKEKIDTMYGKKGIANQMR